MEGRYLVAALAIIATFAVFSRGFRTLERVSLSYGQHAGAELKAKCNADASAASRFMGKVRTHLRPGYPEEAQLLAEMNLPIAMSEAKVAEQVARQNMAAARGARETALREAERAQREAKRMRDRMAHPNAKASAMPIAWGVISDSDAASADAESEQGSDSNSNDAGSRVHCNAAQSREQQTAQAIRDRSRAIVHELEQSLGYR